MYNKYDTQSKTLGPKSSYLVTTLYERDKQIFRLRDVQDILQIDDLYSAIFIRKLIKKGIVTRLKPGLFILVPFELGKEREYTGNPYIVSHEIMDGKEYYLSHGTAMEIYGMKTQPQLVVYVAVLKQQNPVIIHGVEFRFVSTFEKYFWGFDDYWASKQEKVKVSNLEKTIIDGLKEPQYCGGITEVAKGLWLRHQDIQMNRLVEYAVRMDMGAVIRRLGYLMELYSIGTQENLDFLKSRLTESYMKLDPHLSSEREYLKKWKLQINVTPEELLSVIRT